MKEGASLRLVNRRTAETISDAVEVAATRRSRRRGLLGRDGIGASESLLLAPCCAIHTAFMRFAIDVVFVAADGHVLKIVQNLGPWRMAWSARAHAVFELAPGSLNGRDLQVGDAVELAPAM